MIPIVRKQLPPEVVEHMAALTADLQIQAPENRPDRARTAWRQTTNRARIIKPVRSVLAQMAPGAELCMYCGDNYGTDVDHHEPIARNPLRAFDWLNHLLACCQCNSNCKRDQFPVDDDGNALLIDPTTEDPFDHLMLALSVGEYTATSVKGEWTIAVCGLNRHPLTRGRQQAYRVVTMCLREWPSAARGTGPYTTSELRDTILEQPCADVCQAMLRYVDLPGAPHIFSGAPDLLELLRDQDIRDALLIGGR